MMRTMEVTLGWGMKFTASAFDLDRAIEDYLPASPGLLRSVVADRMGPDAPADLDDVRSVTELLVVLAALDREHRTALLAVAG